MKIAKSLVFLLPILVFQLLFIHSVNAQVEVISKTNHTYKKQSKSCEKKGFECYTLIANWETVKVSDKKIEKMVNEYITESIKFDTLEILENQMEEYNNISKEDIENMYEFDEEDEEYSSMFLQHSDEISYSVGLINKSVSCIYQTLSSYAGGAHGNVALVPTLLNNKNQEVITFLDLLKDTAFVKNEAIKQLKNNDESLKTGNGEFKNKLQDYGYFISEEEFYLSETISIEEDKLSFIYQPYEIAPYVMGIIQISFTKKEILPYLKFNPWE